METQEKIWVQIIDNFTKNPHKRRKPAHRTWQPHWVIEVFGDTFPLKEKIKSFGFNWSSEGKSWTTTKPDFEDADALASQVAAEVSGLYLSSHDTLADYIVSRMSCGGFQSWAFRRRLDDGSRPQPSAEDTRRAVMCELKRLKEEDDVFDEFKDLELFQVPLWKIAFHNANLSNHIE